ncbi:MAG: hypothetical protein KAJ19_26575, partial [Gammaproteobacteria bacterium]|nr:hypothetical protein [Gammaproteobacteria bacterium]
TTVPFDSVGYIVQWWGSLSKKLSASSVIRLRGGTLDGLGYILQSRAINTSGSSSFDYKYTVPMVAGPGVDVWVEADTDTNNTGVASGFGIKFIKIN